MSAMKLFFRYLRQRRRIFFYFIVCVLICFLTFALYHLPLAAVAYPAVLCLLVCLLGLFFDFLRVWRRHMQMEKLKEQTISVIDRLPTAQTISEADDQALLEHFQQEHQAFEKLSSAEYEDMLEYYTVWAHQIKTPIASMRLRLQQEDSPLSRQLQPELSRIEQYADMVMAYLRLGSDTTDYVIRECDLDNIVRPAVRKFAGEFIGRHLKLDYQPLHVRVLTDEKWLGFVVEQVISNALKYTPEGSVSIYLEEPMTLCIRDTGIGIAEEDLPRIFERGYTGLNGRRDRRASGLGLYLCSRICKNLGHRISARSKEEDGTVICIGLERSPMALS